jgi:DNA primase
LQLNDELFLLTVVSINYGLYPEFRKAVSIREIANPAAKDLFIALEECFVHDEAGLDSILSRISSPELRDFVITHGASKEFTINPEQLVADGIRTVVQKRLKHRIDEIVRELRSLGSDANAVSLAEELLAEKMHVDEELRKFS